MSNAVTAPAKSAVTREAIAARIAENSSRMTVQLARELGVPEVNVIEALQPEQVTELDVSRWEELIRSFEELENVHVIATNGAVTLECFGQFGKFSTWGEYFNVQTKSLDMHIRHTQLARAFAVIKPGHMDGVTTVSFQFYDHNGHSAFKVFLTFGGKAPSKERMDAFNSIRDRFRLGANAQ